MFIFYVHILKATISVAAIFKRSFLDKPFPIRYRQKTCLSIPLKMDWHKGSVRKTNKAFISISSEVCIKAEFDHSQVPNFISSTVIFCQQRWSPV
jgi:hypothetical protein